MENTKIKSLIDRNLPFSIFTKPGQGVVSQLSQLATDEGMGIIKFQGSLMEMGDIDLFRGIPYISNGELTRAPSTTASRINSRIESSEKFILIIEEFDSFPYDVAKELLEFIENRSGMFPIAIIHHSENEVTQMLKDRSLQVEL